MLRIELTPEVYALVDDADVLLLSGFPWRLLGPNESGVAYVHAWNGKQSVYMHRLVIGAGPGEEVDHADGNGLNNQRYNLRIASRG